MVRIAHPTLTKTLNLLALAPTPMFYRQRYRLCQPAVGNFTLMVQMFVELW